MEEQENVVFEEVQEITDDDKLWSLLSWITGIAAIIALLMEDKKDRAFVKYNAVMALVVLPTASNSANSSWALGLALALLGHGHGPARADEEPTGVAWVASWDTAAAKARRAPGAAFAGGAWWGAATMPRTACRRIISILRRSGARKSAPNLR